MFSALASLFTSFAQAAKSISSQRIDGLQKTGSALADAWNNPSPETGQALGETLGQSNSVGGSGGSKKRGMGEALSMNIATPEAKHEDASSILANLAAMEHDRNGQQ